ncbi:hypothetical protein EV659_102195 [Rhodothalassium salexigens DSM 2132]|uniref:N-acetyltransferase domain-containing protein n=1 Tax=Rhodothalassium salexigens DSM 2132 TaxID=1188247 RepID=A0A4R2PS66_RHOSA|nr:hypothetical protein [Rhodothalassium salexigens]MBB4210656.1 hypothetical protein [Rhodothalassium salexigens DSM 2132]MBK1637857.1 hypothetical protein [Rhodothalassium salexigens DSM 2132]TCP37788.1 hypothetical protein EV659_102195 [Rhodothalassium salexigens DSM 2132]
MTQSLTLRPVTDRADLRAFIRMPRQVFADDPNWIVPLDLERRDVFDKQRNPYFATAEAQYWIAERGGRPVGRISAQVDELARGAGEPGLGHFGAFDCLDDTEAAAALFQAAEDWLRARGTTRVTGPFTLSINEETGLLIDGFDTPPRVMMGHAKPYYARLVETQGYAKVRDIYAYDLDLTPGFPPKVARIVAAGRRNPRLAIRHVNMADLDREIRVVFDIFNKAWAGNWGFVPFNEDQLKHAAKTLKPLIGPERCQIVEYDGRPAAFMITIADVNDWIADLNGSLMPFGWARMVWRLYRSYPTRVRVPLMGVLPEFQRGALGATMAFMLINDIRDETVKRGARQAELGWILEDNAGMNNMLRQIGCRIYKTYRIYEKAL